ncbi:hypothetical protein LCGC14_0519610 [marine sediment metagenome]|uniref:DUF3368 domain-containing protein n=1 Tax=marine sediment metagenome TaxID=412755 RepID=A0A0F9UKD7_9ZZZZ
MVQSHFEESVSDAIELWKLAANPFHKLEYYLFLALIYHQSQLKDRVQKYLKKFEADIVVKGKEQSDSDAYILERAVNNELIKIEAVKKGNENITSLKLHEAEIDTIKLYLQSNFETILLDDEEARVFAYKLGIKVSGTLGILVKLYRNGIFGFSEALQYLKKINEIMYLSSDVYCYIEKVLKEISQSD